MMIHWDPLPQSLIRQPASRWMTSSAQHQGFYFWASPTPHPPTYWIKKIGTQWGIKLFGSTEAIVCVAVSGIQEFPVLWDVLSSNVLFHCRRDTKIFFFVCWWGQQGKRRRFNFIQNHYIQKLSSCRRDFRNYLVPPPNVENEESKYKGKETFQKHVSH